MCGFLLLKAAHSKRKREGEFQARDKKLWEIE